MPSGVLPALVFVKVLILTDLYSGGMHFFTIIGMLFGAAIYAEVYPAMESSVLTWGNFGKITLPDVTGINEWILIVLLIIIFFLLFRFLGKKGL